MYCDKVNKIPPWDQSQLEAIAKVLADTSSGLTGSEIAHLLPSSHIIDCDPTNAKWERLYNAFAEFQNQRQAVNNIIRFIHLAMVPARYTNSLHVTGRSKCTTSGHLKVHHPLTLIYWWSKAFSNPFNDSSFSRLFRR